MTTSLWDLFPRDLFAQMREEGYIRVQTLDDSTLAIANYAEKTQFEQKWNAVTLQCRGLIFDFITETVVSRPFAKFFNWDDSSQPYPPRGQCMLMPKMDGSLGILYRHHGEYKIATRGSFKSDQAIHATQVLQELLAETRADFENAVTYLFEIIYPENRIVVDYGSLDDLVLLDVIDNATGHSRFDLFHELVWKNKVSRQMVVFDDSLIHEIPSGDEGFVLYWHYQNFRVKMKSAEYLSLHKLIFGLNARGVWERLGAGDTWQQICYGLPDEFHAWVKNIADGLNKQAEKIAHDAQREFKEALRRTSPEYYEEGVPLIDARRQDRKAFAIQAAKSPLKSYLFLLYDGKDITDEIWKTLRPSGTDQIKVLSEDVA